MISDSTSFPDRVGWVPFCTAADPNTPKHKKYPKSLPMEQASDSVHCHSWQSPDRGGWGSTQCPLALLYNAIPPLLLIAFVGPFGTGLVLQLVIVGLSDGIERCKHTVLSLAQSSIEA